MSARSVEFRFERDAATRRGGPSILVLLVLRERRREGKRWKRGGAVVAWRSRSSPGFLMPMLMDERSGRT